MEVVGKSLNDLEPFTNFTEAQTKAYEYLGDDAILFTSPKRDKKYRIYNPIKDKWVDFGQMGYEDFTKHQDEDRRQNYLARATKIKGNWRNDKYSPNNLAIHILW
jgi:hypothetical protein